MPHTAATYTVRVKVKRSPDYRSLGDIDEKGTWLAEVIDGYLPSLRASTDDDLRLLTCKKSELEDDQLFAVMRNGERGVAADLIGEGGAVEFRQHPRHLHDMKTGILLRLPPSEDLGWLCIHLNNRRGAKALLCNELIANFREDFPQLMLEINPCVAGAALQEAIDRGAIQKLKLVRFDHPDDSANRAASGKWVDRNVTARIELDVSGVLRSTGRVLGGSRINPNLIRRFFRGDRSTFGQIVE
ncbi:MAG TPA: hypothetical protein VEJ87_04050, partial [Acidimicrobiales bacterium]|nr:hypothetical protein [Acidimicrobiales bacterium]